MMKLSALSVPAAAATAANRSSDAPAPAQDAATFQELLSKLSAPDPVAAPRTNAGDASPPGKRLFTDEQMRDPRASSPGGETRQSIAKRCVDPALPESAPATSPGQESPKAFACIDTAVVPKGVEDAKKGHSGRSEKPSADDAVPPLFFPPPLEAQNRVPAESERCAAPPKAGESAGPSEAASAPAMPVAAPARSQTGLPHGAVKAGRESPVEFAASLHTDSEPDVPSAVPEAPKRESTVHQAADFAAGGQALPAAHTNAAPALPVLFSLERPAAAPVQAAAAPRTPALRLGEAGWEGGLGAKIVWMAAQRQQVAELHVSPPDLGPVKIVLALDDDKASAQFVSPHALVRAALEQALPQLQQVLAQNGITLSNATVSSDSFQGHDHAGGRDTAPRWPATGAAIATRESLPLRMLRGLVDTFA